MSLEAHRTIAFAFAATRESAADAATAALKQLPFAVTMTQPGGGELRVITASSDSIGLVPGLATWAPKMREIGTPEGTVYDGWLAVFDDVDPGAYVNFTLAY